MKIVFLIMVLAVLGVVRADSPAAQGENSIYSPAGKRDPFRPPSKSSLGRDVASVSPLERFGLEQLQLRAILKGADKNRAMFEDPDGKTHIVFEGMILGREKASVSHILNTEVVITEKTINYLGEEALTEKIISLENGEDSQAPQLRRGR